MKKVVHSWIKWSLMTSVKAMVQNKSWNRVGIVVRPGKKGANQVTRVISNFLLDKGSRVYVSGIPKEQLPAGIEPCALDAFDVDLLVTLGGDGTVLHAVQSIHKNIPIFAINLGSRGFLTETEPDKIIEDLEQVFNHKYVIEANIRLNVETEEHSPLRALNEALITSRIPSKMVYLELLLDNVKMWRGFADGVIIATPTGSTAHSASAGGALVDLRVEAAIIVFISPLDFSMRPLVVPTSSIIEIKILEGGKDGLLVIDGQIQIPVNRNQVVRITKSQYPVKFLRIQKYSHLYRLSKLRKNLEKHID